MDDKAVFFSANNIWYVEGQGPPNTGAGSDLTTAVLVPSDVGCIDWRSIVEIPAGLMFQAPNGGIYLLDRGLNVTFVGRDVQDVTMATTGPETTGFGQIVQAVANPRTHQARFSVQPTAGGSPFVLEYDYVLSRWTRSTSISQAGSSSPTCMALSQGVYYAGYPNWVAYENPYTATAPWVDTDASGTPHFVSTVITLGHVHVASVNGYQRSRHIIGEATWLEVCDIVVQASYDYGALAQAHRFPYQSLVSASFATARFDMHTMATAGKCEAVQVTMYDQAPTGVSFFTGQGARFLGVTFELQTLDNKYRRGLPAIVKA
jgi:hypothetical protein